MKLAAYTHVIWDWNGTLLDDAWLCIEVMNESLARRALPLLTPERYQRVFDFPVIRYYERLGFDLEREPFEVVGAEFIVRYEARRHEASLQPDAREALERLRAAGKAQSILSAYRHDALEELLRHHGVREFFDPVVGADDIYAHGKVAQGRALLDRLGTDPARVALVGDTAHDAEVAKEIGCACFLVPRGNHSRERLASCGVEVVESLRELF